MHTWFKATLAVALVVCCTACEGESTAVEDNVPKLRVTERSATTLKLEWDSFSESGWHNVDIITGQTSCEAFPDHHSTYNVHATSLEVKDLTPSTVYHIHVHWTTGPTLLVAPSTQKSQTVLVATLAAGSAAQPVTPAQYQACT